MPPPEDTGRLTARFGLPASGWFAGAMLALAQGILGGVNAAALGHAAVALGAVGCLAGLLERAALAAGRAARDGLLRRRWTPETALAAPLTVVAAPFVLWLTSQAFSGRRMATLPFRPALIAATAALALVLVFALARGASSRLRHFAPDLSAAPTLALAGATFFLVAGLLLWADNILFVRRYEWFHLSVELGAFLAAQAMALVVAGLVIHRSMRRAGTRQARSVTFTALASCLALLAGQRSSEALWADDQEGWRAELFAAEGVLATTLELLRPRQGLAAPGPASASASMQPKPLLLSGAAQPALRGADVILVTVDALRADHLGFAGYRRGTSPKLDALAARSTVFERAYTPSPHTSFALASVLTGRHVFSLARAGRLDGVTTLADAFKTAGYRTVGLFPPAVFFVERERFDALERRRYGFEKVRFESLDELNDAARRTNQAIEALNAPATKASFLWIHYFGPHEPYVHHQDLAGSPLFGARAIDRYDEEIRYVDRELGRLVDELDRRGRPYLLVVTADHGEEFGDHNGAYHGTSLFDEQIHVPLLVHASGGGNRRVRSPVSTIDVAATVASLVGLAWRAPPDSIDRSATVLYGNAATDQESPPAFAELESLKAVIAAEWKLICDTARDYCRLFDVVNEPAERRDVAPQVPLVANALRATLQTWLRRPPDLEPPGPAAALLWAAQRWDSSALMRLGEIVEADGGMPATLPERRAAAKVMARSPLDEHRLALASVVQNEPDRLVRLWAAVALAALGDAPAVTTIAEIPAAGFGDPELASRAALALAGAAHPEAGTAVAAALAGEVDVNLRCRLVMALAASGHPRAAPILLDAYPQVRSRVCVAKAFAHLEDETVLPFLMARLQDEPYSTVRAAIALALGRFRSRTATEALVTAFHHDRDDAVSAAIAKALAKLGRGATVLKGRRVRVPSTAQELWVVTKPGADGELRVLGTRRSRPAMDTQVDLRAECDAYPVPLPPGGVDFLRVSAPATHVLFR
jgi:arylsulfatase A-like enzyme